MKPIETLIGPAATVLVAARAHLQRATSVALLFDGDPGVGKTHLADQLALELAGHPLAIERVNGQSVSVDLVRAWSAASAYGNLFGSWTVKRIDALDYLPSAPDFACVASSARP